jgi:predicted dithiol-disulfide oxidoreductase (DUF899 family)
MATKSPHESVQADWASSYQRVTNMGLTPWSRMYQWLDRAPLGRNETGMWWRRHDEYDR